MEILKKDIQCTEIVKKVERLTTQVRKFIQLVNRQLPKELKLNKEHFIIKRREEDSFLNDGNTTCAGFAYQMIWAYTPSNVKTKKHDILKKKQGNAVTFVFKCSERCYDHRKNRLDFFFLYYKGQKKKENEEAERIDYINDNYDENALFRPYELMEVVWKIWNEWHIMPSNISKKPALFQEFLETFEQDNVRMRALKTKSANVTKNQQLPEEIRQKMEHFEEEIERFTAIVNCYCAVASKKVSKEDMSFFWKAAGENGSQTLIDVMEQFIRTKILASFSDAYQFIPKKFKIERDSYATFAPNEEQFSFRLFDCLKYTVGYSYFNEYIFEEGVRENWHPRLLYFSYYLSKDFQEEHYTISLTSCEGRFRENYMTTIEENSLEELLAPQNAIKIAKWLEEIWRKTALMYYYRSIIEEERIRNFSSNCEID